MTCPTCKAKVAKDQHPKFPFCSERCQLIDLGRWFGEEFRVPSERPPDGTDTSEEG